MILPPVPLSLFPLPLPPPQHPPATLERIYTPAFARNRASLSVPAWLLPEGESMGLFLPTHAESYERPGATRDSSFSLAPFQTDGSPAASHKVAGGCARFQARGRVQRLSAFMARRAFNTLMCPAFSASVHTYNGRSIKFAQQNLIQSHTSA